MTRGLAVPIGAFLLSVPIAFANTRAAMYSWLITAVLANLALAAASARRRR